MNKPTKTKSKAFAVRNKDLLVQSAEIQGSIKALDLEIGFTYYALRTWALKQDV